MKQHPVMTRFPPDEYERFQKLMLKRGIFSAGELVRRLACEECDRQGLEKPAPRPPGARQLPSVPRVPSPPPPTVLEAPEELPSSKEIEALAQGRESHLDRTGTEPEPPEATPPEEATAETLDDEPELLPPAPQAHR